MGYVTGQIGGEENGGFKLRLSLPILVSLFLVWSDVLAAGTLMLLPKSYVVKSGQSSRPASAIPTNSSFRSGRLS